MRKWQISIVVLIALGLIGFIWAKDRFLSTANDETAVIEEAFLKVDGMTCGACAIHIQNELQGVKGVKEAEVSLEKKEAIVKYKEGKVTVAKLIEAVKKAGYQASVKK